MEEGSEKHYIIIGLTGFCTPQAAPGNCYQAIWFMYCKCECAQRSLGWMVGDAVHQAEGVEGSTSGWRHQGRAVFLRVTVCCWDSHVRLALDSALLCCE